MEYYKILISLTARNSLREKPELFHWIEETFLTTKEVKQFIIDRYGKNIYKGKNKMYIDTKTGEKKHIGYLYSFWNQDISHNSKKYYETDWIEVKKINSETVIKI